MSASTESAAAALNGAGKAPLQSFQPAPPGATATAMDTGRRRWLGLGVIAMSQLRCFFRRKPHISSSASSGQPGWPEP